MLNFSVLVSILLTLMFSPLNAALGYVTNAYNGTVSVVDTVFDQVVSTIPVGLYPKSIAITPDGTKIYVANFESCDISVIDSIEQNVIATIPVADYPNSISISSDGKSVFVSHLGNQVSIIDSQQDLVIDYATGNEPNRRNEPTEIVAKVHEQQKLYVANFESPYLQVINCKTNEILTTLDVGIGTTDMTFCKSPLVTELSAYYGPLSGGNYLLIKGTNFSNVVEVYFGSVKTTQFRINSDHEICVIVPSGLLGTVDVTVLNKFQVSAAHQACQYAYVLPELRPPLNFKGDIISKEFLNETVNILEMSWKPSPSSDVVLYRIFKGDNVEKEIFSNSLLRFTTEVSSYKEARKYEIVAVSSENLESPKAKINVENKVW